MHERSTSQSSWHSAQSQVNKREAPRTRWPKPNNYWITLQHIQTRPFGSERRILNVHSDASYLSESKAHSRACGHFFMGWSPKDGDPIKLNGAFFTLCTILRFVVASAAEAELGALFLNCKEGIIFRLTLEELGHPQPRTPVHCDNATSGGIANNTVKRQRS